MLKLKAEASVGISLREQLLSEMLDLARRTGCSVEVKANDVTFWVYPNNTIQELKKAYDRLYPKSRIVSAYIKFPIPVEEGGS